MKKIISKILAAALIISVLPAYPVSAEEGASAAVVAAEKQEASVNEGGTGIQEDLGKPENDGTAVLVDGSEGEEVKNFEGFEYKVLEDGTVEIAGYSGKETGDLIIPDSIEGKDVTKIGSYAFKDCIGFDGKLKLPEKLTKIDHYAFTGCIGFGGVLKLPESLTSIGWYAFEDCSGFTGELELSEVFVDRGAFVNCSGLEELKVSAVSTEFVPFNGCSGLKRLKLEGKFFVQQGLEAFGGCSSLEEVIISEKYTDYMSDMGFPVSNFHYLNDLDALANIEVSEENPNYSSYGGCLYNKEQTDIICCPCGKKEVTLPEGLMSIGFSAFANCNKLASITIPEGVRKIEDCAFSDCSGLTGELKLPESLTSIGQRAFQNCSGLDNIEVSEGNENYSSYDGCLYNKKQTEIIYCPSGKKEVTLTESLERIGNSAFQNCVGLTSIMLPDGVTNIEYQAFEGCSGLTSVTIPESVTSIGSYAFSGCSGLNNIEVSEGNENYSSYDGCLYNKEQTDIICCPKRKREISLPKGLTNIGSVFSGCSELTSIMLPEGIRNIEYGAFSGCSSLASITLPEGVTNIGNVAFSGCSSLASITFPEGVTSIGNSAFSGCSSLASVMFPESLESIGSSAFENCSGLTSITLPEGVKEIWEYAFRGCSGLTGKLKLPESLESIRSSAFENCSGLTSITIPEGVTNIWNSGFRGCSSLVNIEVPKANPSYSSYDGCLYNKEQTEIICCPGGKKEITLPGSLTSIWGAAFSGCSELARITLPEGVTEIGGSAFRGCSSLANINIPEGVTNIGDSAFENCSGLRNIAIPNSCKRIGEHALGYSYIYSSGEVYSIIEDFTIICGKGSAAEAYAQKNGIAYQNFSGTACTRHEYDKGTVTKEATCAAEGEMSYTCWELYILVLLGS